MPIFSSSVPYFVYQKWRLTFMKGRCVWSLGQTLVGSLIFPFYLWETTLKDERPHYLQWISGAAQGLAATATLPQRCHRCVLFCSMSYLLIYSPPPPTHDSLLISPIKINPHLKISTLARQRGCNRGGDGLSQSSSLPLPRAH